MLFCDECGTLAPNTVFACCELRMRPVTPEEMAIIREARYGLEEFGKSGSTTIPNAPPDLGIGQPTAEDPRTTPAPVAPTTALSPAMVLLAVAVGIVLFR